MLDYDNSAFYYFSITLLCFYIIPGTYFFLSEIYDAYFRKLPVEITARTALEKEKSMKLQKQIKGSSKLMKWSFILNTFFLIFAYVCFIYLFLMVYQDGEVSRFDPYQILGVEMGTDLNDIKRSYRKLTLKYHPDKNPGDKLAEEMFMKIAKAYEALTDPVARENYEKFGSPDGKQSLEVSIGLPVALLENPKVVLVLYLIGMVVLIPVVVGLWYSNSKQYGEKNIKYESYSLFYQLLTEGTRIKQMPEVFSAAAECRDLFRPDLAREQFGKLYGKLKTEKALQKTKFDHPNILQTNLLVHAYCLRMDSDLTPDMKAHLEKILKIAPELIEGMIEIAHQKKFLQTTLSTIEFSQCVIQGLWHTDHSLLQLPHLTENEVTALSPLLVLAAFAVTHLPSPLLFSLSISSAPQVKHITRGGKVQARSLREYLHVPDEEKKGLSTLSEEEKADVLLVCNEIIPKLKVEWKLFVEEDEEDDALEGPPEDKRDENVSIFNSQPLDKNALVKYKELSQARSAISGERIYENDLISLRLTITRENVLEGNTAPPVHAPHFPRPVKETWWAVLTDKPKVDPKKGAEPQANLYSIEKITDQSRVVKHVMRFAAPPKAGKYSMVVQLLSSCYLGLDMSFDIDFEVFPASELPEYMPHPEDVSLDNEATLFEQMLVTNLDESSSDEESDGEDDDGKARITKKKSQAKKVVEEEEDDEDEEED